MASLPASVVTALQNRYRLERELGAGGMASVYLARDFKHDREVALKVLRPELAVMLAADRFLQEVRLTARLQHPHIVTLIDFGEAGGTLYYVLPFIEGESLRQRLTREGQLPLEDALRITRGVAGALQYAHDEGVIHRDIKPENILLSRGEPIVADFGIALAAASAGGKRLTETGLSLGTPAYMSPEQASAEPRLDGRTDQYSLACVVYEMLAGEPPYGGHTAHAIIAKRLSEPVPRLGTVRQVPAGVEAAVTRALANAPADRFPRIAEFAAALERPAPMPRRKLRRRVAAVLGGVGVLLLLALAAWIFRRPARPGAMVTRQLTFTGNACCPSLSPDGKWVAFDRNDSLMVEELSGSRPVFVAHEGLTFDRARWSPDGARILYPAQDSQGTWLFTVPRLGGVPRRIVKAGFLASFSYSADGRQVGFSNFPLDSVFIADVASGEVVRRIALAPRLYMAALVRYSPDGRWIATGGPREEGIQVLTVISPDGSTMHRLVDWVDRGTVEWSPRGDALYFFQRVPGGSDLMKVRVDPETGERRGPPVRVISQAPFHQFSVGADGRTLLYQKNLRTSQVWTMTIAGPPGRTAVQAKLLTSGTARFGNPAISPDGRWVVYAQDEVTERNLYVVPYEGGAPRLIGPTRTDYVTPRWAPDNRRLAFASADSTAGGIIVADLVEGQLRHHGHSALGVVQGTLAWSPDGRKLLFPSGDPRRFVLLDVESGEEANFAPPKPLGALHGPIFSPDGQEVIISVSNGHSDRTLWRVGVSTGEWQPLHGGDWHGTPLVWSPEGWIYLMRGREIWRVRSSRRSSQLYATLPMECWYWGERPSLDDGAARFVCTLVETKSDIWVATDFDPDVR